MVRKKYYPFINDKGEEFIFLQHGEGSCQFCPLASGLVNLNQKEFIKFCKKDLEKDEKISSYHDGDLPLAIFQSLFDFTLDEEISYIFQDLIPKLANSLISNTVPEKYKYPMLLYFTHLIVNVPGALQAIYGISFFIFSEEFIHDFLENFSINFMQKTRETMVKVMVPKKDQPKHDPKDKKKKQKVEVEMEEIEIPAKGMIFWDNERRSFIVKEAKLSEEYVAERKKYNTDELTDEGKFSKYFWRLHFIYHLFKMLLETIKKHSKTSKNVLLTQLEHFCTQVKDLTIIFQKYTEKYIPTSPFHEDTECWGDIRTLMFEIMVFSSILIISRLFSKKSNFYSLVESINFPINSSKCLTKTKKCCLLT